MKTVTLSARWTASLLAFALLGAAVARAALLTPLYLSDYSSQYASDGRTADKCYDGNKVTTTVNQMWLATTATPQITFLFDGRYRLDSLNVWNYNEAGLTSRGIQNAQVYISNDWGRSYSLVASPTFARAPGNLTIAPTEVSLGGVAATNVRITGLSNHGGGAWAGLTEVEPFGTSLAGVVTRVATATVTSVSSEYSQRLAAYTLDGKKDNTNPNNAAWHSNFNDLTPTITYQLGGRVRLDHLLIWNYNEVGHTTRGFQTFEILASTDGINFSLVTDPLDGDTIFALAQNNGQVPALTNFVYLGGVTATHLRLHALSNFGGNVTGLNEVEFYSIPEPATAGVFLLGALLCGRRRRPGR